MTVSDTTERMRVVGHDLREGAKVAVRAALHRRNLDLVKDPLPSRVSATMKRFGLDTVIDVGANFGQYGRMLRAAGFDGRIVSCEPMSHAYAFLARRAGKDSNWTALQTALGAHAGTIEINISRNSYSSSVLPITSTHTDAAPTSVYVSRETVPVRTIADLIESEEIDPTRAWLKVDTQGYESRVLDGAQHRLAEFAAIQIELSMVTLYEGQILFDEMVARLTAAGFVLWGLDSAFIDPETGRTLQCDGVFVRNELQRAV